MGGQDKCVSSVSMASLSSLSLGDKLSQSEVDDTNGMSLSNGARSSGTANGTGTSTIYSGRNVVVSRCEFPQGPTGSELREVKFEEGRKITAA